MKKSVKLLAMILLCIGFVITNSTYAASSGKSSLKSSGTNYYTGKVPGYGATDSTKYSYYIGGSRVYCVDCGTTIQTGVTYKKVSYSSNTKLTSKTEAKVVSYIIKSSANSQVKQAALWKYINGATITAKTSSSTYTTTAVTNLIDEAEKYVAAQDSSYVSTSFSPGQLNFKLYEVETQTDPTEEETEGEETTEEETGSTEEGEEQGETGEGEEEEEENLNYYKATIKLTVTGAKGSQVKLTLTGCKGLYVQSSLDNYASNIIELDSDGSKDYYITTTSANQKITFNVYVMSADLTTDPESITLTATPYKNANGKSVSANSKVTIYEEASEWHYGSSQVLATANSSTVTMKASTAKGSVKPVGGLKVQKVDVLGENIQLEGVEFILKDAAGNEVATATTDSTGLAVFSEVTIGTYYLSESEESEELLDKYNLALSDEVVEVVIEEHTEENYPICSFENREKYGKLKIIKKDTIQDGEYVKIGDADLTTAVFTLYAGEDFVTASGNVLYSEDDVVVENITLHVNEETGQVESDVIENLPLGHYYLKETTIAKGYELLAEEVRYVEVEQSEEEAEYDEDGNLIRVYEEETVSIESWYLDIVQLTGDDEYQEEEILNRLITGKIKVYKYDNGSGSDKNPATGAVLRLTLDSNPDIYYDVVINEEGYAEFIDEAIQAAGREATIPYGTYTITEIESSDEGDGTRFFIQPVTVSITENEQVITVTSVSDEPVPAYLKITKIDADTGEAVEIERGTGFKIWSVDNDEWVTFFTQYQSDIVTLYTTEDGWLKTPQQLDSGTYVIYETEVPDGYYLEDSLRVPDDESYLGNVDYGGVEVVIDDNVIITGDKVYTGDTSELCAEVEVSDRPLKVSLEVYKTGEVFANVSTSNTEYGEKATPEWQEQGLAGATYNLIAAEDIMSPDGKHTYVTAGTTYTATTDEDGVASFEELYPGTYTLVEVEAPEGYVLDTQERTITLTNDDSLERVKVESISLTDTRQKLELTFKKIFEEIEYSATTEQEQTAVFGVYAGEDIKNYAGNIVISKDTLVDVITVTGNNPDATSTVDLPEGTYYVRELDTSYPYVVSDEVQYFTLEYTSDGTQEFVVIEGNDFENEAKSAPLILLKLSTSSTDSDGILSLSGSEVTEESMENLDNLSKEIATAVLDMTVDETLEYLKELLGEDSVLTSEEKEKIITVSGVTYQVFVDEDCTQPLYKLNEETGEYTDTVTITTDLTGAGVIYGIPYGTYYVKEISAPRGYTLSNDPVEILVNETTGIPKVFQITYDDSVEGNLITKIDIFTGDVVPDCTFEITDSDGNKIVHAITDEEGNAYIPVDIFEDGATYYYTEIDAPDIYQLNYESHEFVAEIDEVTGEWIADPIEVENVRKTGTVQIIKSDADTGDRLEGCVFTIVLLDEDGNEYVNAAGETVYLVQNAVTDENGEYLIEDVPYGTYKFVEMVAPEGYELDEDMTGLTFTVGDDSTYIVFEVTNTGDIAVIAIAGILILSIVGIVTVVLRRKLANRV